MTKKKAFAAARSIWSLQKPSRPVGYALIGHPGDAGVVIAGQNEHSLVVYGGDLHRLRAMIDEAIAANKKKPTA